LARPTGHPSATTASTAASSTRRSRTGSSEPRASGRGGG
jgi:hypothetical protein